jgi:hypothetical protein
MYVTSSHSTPERNSERAVACSSPLKLDLLKEESLSYKCSAGPTSTEYNIYKQKQSCPATTMQALRRRGSAVPIHSLPRH